jgi:serine/threonine protein kinase/tetratricopeptide (TPR) repeat protein
MLAPGTELGRYRLTTLLGVGGMGEVYRARDLRLDRDVAVKVLPQRFAEDQDRLARFEREAKAVAALAHPNILSIYDYVTIEGVSLAVMELLEGETLRRRLDRGPLTWDKVLLIGIPVADGLASAHAKGIVHRDLKPANLFLTSEGRVKILDFGLARVIAPAPSVETQTGSYHLAQTDPGAVMGTVIYMSPEQVRGQPVDGRSDIFSLGNVLYEMLAGKPPFMGDTAPEIQAAILRDAPPPLRTHVNDVPQGVEQLVRRCLEKDPHERFQSARDLAFVMQAQAADGGSGPSPKPAAAVKSRPSRRRKTIDSLAVLPVVNKAADPQLEYLCDGITESIIQTLSHLPKLRIMARSTVFRYKGCVIDPQTVGANLGVRAILTGNISTVGEGLNLSVELVDVSDGSLLWAEQYRPRLADILAVQETIAKEITEHLRLKLTGKDKERLRKRYTEDNEAYQLYLKGRYYWNKRTADGFNKAITFFQEATAKDPQLALAHAGLADTYNNLGSYGIVAPREAFPQAKAAAFMALKLDDSLAEAHICLAFGLFMFDWDWPVAGREFQRALTLNSGHANAHHWYAWYLLAIGRIDESLEEMRAAHRLDILSLPINTNIAFIYYFARRFDQAIDHFRKALEMDPTFAEAHRGLGESLLANGSFDDAVTSFREAVRFSGRSSECLAELAYSCILAGKFDEAHKTLDEFTALSKSQYTSAHDLATIHIALGEKDKALELLEKAYQERSYRLAWIKVDPRVDSLRSEPLFLDIINRMKLPP